MANALYPVGKRAFLNKEIEMDLDSITAVLVKNTYTYSAAHTSYTTDVQPHIVSGASVVLANKQILNTNNNAVFDADDPVFVAVTAGSTVSSIVLYHTSSKKLIAYIDTGAGLPFSTNGGDVTINFSNGDTRIFAL